jgi:thiamine-monophosphate kinase
MSPDGEHAVPLAGEDEWVARIASRMGGGRGVVLGIGSDCAALDLEGAQAVVTTDVLVDGRHFVLAECGPAAAAAKAVAVNLSDLAAAGAEPIAYFVGLVLPRDPSAALMDGLVDGFAEAAKAFACPCAGGDTNTGDGPLVIAVTAIGRAGSMGVVTRAGARPGDVLSVTGPLGGSLRGRHLTTRPRLHESRTLVRLRIPHAMMDLSDGLSRDLPRLCRASGVGARVVGERVPVHPDAEAAATPAASALEHALDDGEDFELLVAHGPLDVATRAALDEAGVALVEIGRVEPKARGIRLELRGGSLPLIPRGFDHLRPRA